MSVFEVCKEIRDKYEGSGGADHGLFWPDQRKWLVSNKVLDYYDLKSGDTLEFKKKHRLLKFRTLDGSVKTALIDESSLVKDLVAAVCEKIGLSNSDEYSFQREVDPSKEPEKTKKKDKDRHEIEEHNWLIPDQSLPEQGLTEADTVILKKKFFFTDQNIDRNDPVQLNLLYNQSKEMIISGKHPCTLQEAIQFGAIQCQIQYGNHEPDKHKPGFLPVSEYVPPEYRKSKDLEKKILVEHSKLQGLSELNAKFRFVQLSRSLKTYGITFFLCKEKQQKKNKLIPVLLGITKQSVVRLDVESKEIMQEWKLTQLRRWAAANNSFTLDFGDYADAYYSVQTPEGEQISQLISGYIDIILKKRKDAEKIVEHEVEEQAVVEEYVRPAKAIAVGFSAGGARQATESHPTGVGMAPGWGGGPQMYGGMQYGTGIGSAYNTQIANAQQSLLQNIRSACALINTVAMDLGIPVALPPIGSDPASIAWRQQTVDMSATSVASQIASHLAAIAAIINSVSGNRDTVDYDAMGSKILTVQSNMGQIGQGMKMLAGLADSDEQKDELLKAAKALAQTTGQMLELSQSVIAGQPSKESFYGLTGEVAGAASDLLGLIDRLDVSEDSQNDLIDAANAVAKASAELVAVARSISTGFKEPDLQQAVAQDTRFVADSVSQLVACAAAISPCITSQLCFDELLEASVLLKENIASLTESSRPCQNAKLTTALHESIAKVEEAIARLIDKAKNGGDKNRVDPLDLCYDQLQVSIEQMLANIADSEGIIRAARDIALTATQYANTLKSTSAETANADERGRLLNSARLLADATSMMVGAAKDASKNTADMDKRQALNTALHELQEASRRAVGPELHVKVFNKLGNGMKAYVTSAHQLTAAIKTAATSNRNQSSQIQMNQASKKVADIIPALVVAQKAYAGAPTDTVSQLKLLQAAKLIITPGSAIISAAKAAAPTIGDAGAQNQLNSTTNRNSDDLTALEKALQVAEDISLKSEIENAVDSVRGMQDELLVASQNVTALESCSEEDGRFAQQQLQDLVKNIDRTVGMLVTGVEQTNGKFTRAAAADAVSYLQNLKSASMTLASSEKDENLRQQILSAAMGVGDTLASLISAAKTSIDVQDSPADLDAISKSAAEALSSIVACLPGQRDLTIAHGNISKTTDALKTSGLSKAAGEGETYQTAQTKLQAAASGLTVSANNMVLAARSTPLELKNAAGSYQAAFAKLLQACECFCVKTTDASVSAKVGTHMVEIGSASCDLLVGAKASFSDPANAGLRNQLILSACSVADLVNKLLDVCSASAPGHTECNQSLQSLAQSLAKLEGISDGGSSDSYGDCFVKVSSASKDFATVSKNIVPLAKEGSPSKMSLGIVEVCKVLSAVTDANIRAIYLIGVSDSSSVAAVPPVLDQGSFAQAGADIKDACKELVNPENTQQQILALAASIAKHTSTLCTSCKVAGQNPTVSPLSKQQFITSAKDVAGKTSALVNSLKALAIELSPEAREQCEANTKPLIDAVDKLVSFGMSPDFAGQPAKISETAAVAQRPLIDCNRALLATGQDLANTAKLICTNPKDQGSIQVLSAYVRALTDSIKNVADTIAANAPGQKECDQALEQLAQGVSELEAASMEASINNLAPRPPVDKNSLVDTVKTLSSLVELAAKAVKEDTSQLGSSILEIPSNFSAAAAHTIAIASNSPDAESQAQILNNSKVLGDVLVSFIHTAKQASSAAGIKDAAVKNEEMRAKVRAAISKIVTTLEGSRDDSGEFAKSVEAIEGIVGSLDSRIQKLVTATNAQPYQVCANSIEASCKQVVETVGDVIGKAKTPAQFRELAQKISTMYDQIAQDGGSAICAAEDLKAKQGLQDALRELGGSNIKLIEAMRLASSKSAADSASRLKLNQTAREVSTAVANLMNVLKEGSKGLLVCQAAVGSVNDVISDLESTIIFAQAGQLDPVDTKDNFGRHKDNLLTCAKQMIELAKGFIGAVTGNQEQLATVATNSVKAMEALKDQAKKAAISVTSGDKHMQQQLLSAAKSVSESLQGLINGAMNAFGKTPNDPSMVLLAAAVKVEFGAISDLIRVTKLLGDESSRGIRALDGATTDIDEAVQVLGSEAPAEGTALPEEVVNLAKNLTTAAALLVNVSSGHQDEMVAAANAIKKQVVDLARAGKASTENAPDDKKNDMIEAVRKTCVAVNVLLARVRQLQENNTLANKANIQGGAKQVATAVTEVVTAAAGLVPGGYVDPNDPNVIAERQLLAAAASIEAASKKLLELRPPDKPRAVNEDLNFEDQILEAAKAIAAATAALVRSATGAQREIVSKGKVSNGPGKTYFSDGTWTDGLVSAAKMVANATTDLCEAANQAVKGGVQRERVIASAKAVSSSTTHLLAAATTKTDPNSQAQIRLRAAGKAVTSATDQLVKAAEEALAFNEAEQMSNMMQAATSTTSTTAARVMEMEAQVSILKMEKELEKARSKLAAVRKGRYEGAQATQALSAAQTASAAAASPAAASPGSDSAATPSKTSPARKTAGRM
ncbi:uncharacterized protein BJ171DRAFT_498098 [Polychytrium aggregatum]|uniref:uncharacterized protein n=1 Tax=Polychytrium aggregatum TaxID=110093 RepID=UPI0022FF1E30|nr:uncharacterized protein BJ171DRAFT_498098 [Polychytrium aggregatum]KAI9206533.1 hypothetical protein BJ171DRAFT_498098 [Polychytrium aggregatum]